MNACVSKTRNFFSNSNKRRSRYSGNLFSKLETCGKMKSVNFRYNQLEMQSKHFPIRGSTVLSPFLRFTLGYLAFSIFVLCLSSIKMLNKGDGESRRYLDVVIPFLSLLDLVNKALKMSIPTFLNSIEFLKLFKL